MNAECRMKNAEYRDATLGFAPIPHSAFRIKEIANREEKTTTIYES